ncbi:hypothetical protein HAX54_034641 [Datura stramonium]|uniref:J domain-containing protein n=1 Tax=Datura stramonium TaxID=4076 RepID=A0ABS8SEH6_DATST|nr:hypothetical protein [Datura stramonium]
MTSSFLLSTSITGSELHAAAPPTLSSSASFRRRPLSVSAAYTTAERTTTTSSTSAYRKLARLLHPDVVRSQKNSSAEDFIRVQSAYAILSDPAKRADYDRKQFGNKIARPVDFSSAGARSHYTVHRKWETEQCW